MGDKVEVVFVHLVGQFKWFPQDTLKYGDSEYTLKKLAQKNDNVQCVVSSRINRLSYFFVDPKLNKQIFLNTNCYGKLFLGQLQHIFENGMIFGSDTLHKKKRAMFTTSFHFDVLKNKLEMIKQITNEVFNTIECDDKEYRTFQLVSTIEKITSEVIARSFFGKNFSKRLLNGKPIIIECADVINRGFNDIKTNRFISLKYMLLGKVRARDILLSNNEKELRKRIFILINECIKIIDERILEYLEKKNNQNNNNDKVYQVQEDSKNSEDFLEIFIRCHFNGECTKEDIVTEFFSLFFAGTDTGANLGGMMLHQIAKYPEIKAKMITEVESVMQNQDLLQHSDLKNFTYMEAVMQETLRFFPPATSGFAREALYDHSIGEYQIKKGDFVIPYFLANFSNEKYFKEAGLFRPERWIGEEREQLPKDPFVYIPFSSGPRNCIGQHLALIEIKVIISFFLKKFDFVLNEDVTLRMKRKLLYGPEDERLIKLKKLNIQ